MFYELTIINISFNDRMFVFKYLLNSIEIKDLPDLPDLPTNWQIILITCWSMTKIKLKQTLKNKCI